MKTYNTGYQPRDFQKATHSVMAKHRFGVLVWHRRSGKTVYAINSLIHAAFRFRRRDGRFGYVAPYFGQARKVAWNYCRIYLGDIPGVKFNESELLIKLPNWTEIRLHGSDNPDSMRGVYWDGVVLDEVATMRPEVWGEIIRPALADRGGWALFIGTPKGVNLFHELYEFAQKTKGWHSSLLTVYDTNVIPESEIGLAKSVMTPTQFRQEFLCDFAASTDNVLITVDIVTEACRRKASAAESLKGLPKVMGVDIARFGDDRTVIVKRHGSIIFEPIILSGLDNMLVAGIVAQHIHDWSPDAIFIDAGRGEGVIDRLRQTGHRPIEVNFGSKATDPHYHNMRSEMWCKLRDWIEGGGVLPDSSELRADLCSPTYDFDANDAIKLKSKKQMRKEGLRSTDIGDAAALTFAMHVEARDHPISVYPGLVVEKSGLITEYDPYPPERSDIFEGYR